MQTHVQFRFLFIFLLLCQITLIGQNADEILFHTEGNSFSPRIAIEGDAVVLWTFSDGTTSSALHPEVTFGTAGHRIQRLRVDPWSAVTMINIGYDWAESGSWDIPYVPDQNVSKIENLSLVRNNLEIWCSSYNLLDSLVFDHFIALHTIESFMAQTLTYLSLHNTPALARLCVEYNSLTSLDLSESPALMDIRGAVNDYQDIQFAGSMDDLWHICVRDNPQIVNDTMFGDMTKFPNIAELFIWNDNQSGAFKMSQNHPSRNISIRADGNHYTSLDLRGSLQNENGQAEVSFSWNSLQSVDITGCDQIKHLYLSGNWMPIDTVDKILQQLDAFETWNGEVNLTGNSYPSYIGMQHIANLESRGWIVQYSYFPDINVLGNDVTIQDGDNTPSFGDSTDFGEVFIGDTIIRQFVIQNTGNAILNGWGSSPHFFIYGPDAAYFHVMDTTIFPIVYYGSDTLNVMFTPDSKREYIAEIYLFHEDHDEAPFNFSIRARGSFDNAAVIAAYQEINDEILFLSEGDSFNPLIELNGPADVLWTFYDSTTSADLHPLKQFGSVASRMNRLKVTPWGALSMINIGYDGSDGGWWLPYLPDQHVSYLQNVNLAKDSLKYWCSSYNFLDSLNFDNFINLEDIECFQSRAVKKVSLKNTPKLRRACLEDNDLATFDISESPLLEDIRGALNNYSTISFSDSTDSFWHICVRDNSQVTNDSLFSDMSPFPNISELFIWNMNQSGKFRMSQNHPTRNVSIAADANHYQTIDLSGSLQNENGYAEVYFGGNQVRSINLEGCDQIRRLSLNWNGMSSDTLDKVLQQLDAYGTYNGSAYLGGNEMPGPAGYLAKQNLESRGWYVEISGPVFSLSGNSTNISNGDTIPQAEDNTDFGAVDFGNSVEHDFVIMNNGDYPLHINGIPRISISGENPDDFSVLIQPDSIIDSWWHSSTFRIGFYPVSPGFRKAVVSIWHDAGNTPNPFVFAIQGECAPQISDTVIGVSDTACFGSDNVLALAGDGSQVILESGAVVTLVARQSILFFPGFIAHSGSKAHAWISPDGELCMEENDGSGPNPLKYSVELNEAGVGIVPTQEVTIFPNPSTGLVTFSLKEWSQSVEIKIHNVFGHLVFSQVFLSSQVSVPVDLGSLPPGVYLIRINVNGEIIVKKLIITR